MQESLSQEPRGYKPIQLEYREGHFWLPDGVMFQPDFEISPNPESIALFVEYERTFGRGKAFEITHQTTEESRQQGILEKYGGREMLSRFKRFAQLVPIVTLSGEKKNVEKLIKELKDFRREYSALYEDADQHPNPGHPY